MKEHLNVFLIRGLAIFLSLCPAAWATYSIVGVNTDTKQVGGAGISCVGDLTNQNWNDLGYDPAIGANLEGGIYASVPGKGVGHVQAFFHAGHVRDMKTLIQQGYDPTNIIAYLINPAYDSKVSWRQYGIVDLMGRSAGFSPGEYGTAPAIDGIQNDPYNQEPGIPIDVQGRSGNYFYSAQGNTLTGSDVVILTANGFASGGGCDLPEKLLIAIESGAVGGRGDWRCADRYRFLGDKTRPNLPGDEAFVRVDNPDGSVLINLNTPSGTCSSASDCVNPLTRLRNQFNTWRQTHPCPGTGVQGLQPPTGLTPINGTPFNSTTKVTYSWQAVPGADSYLIRVKDLTGTTPKDSRNTYNDSPFYVYIDVYKGMNITTDVIPGHSYQFWVYSAAANFSISNPSSFSSTASTTSITVKESNGTNNAAGFSNGSFESDYSSWTYSGNQQIVPFSATQGAKAVRFNAGQKPANAVLQQTFSTTAGQSYTLTFDYGIYSPAANREQRLQVNVTGATSRLSKLVSGSMFNSAVSYSSKRFTFVADSATTTLKFQDTSLTSDAIDSYLDNVRIVAGGTS